VTQTIRIVSSCAVGVALVALAVRAGAQVPPTVQPPRPVQTPTPTVTPTPTATATPLPAAGPADYTFPTGAGLIFYYVRTPRAADFEAILGRVKEALLKAESPMLKQQALNWKIYKSAEPATDATVFVFAFDPAITTATYDPLLALAQVLPAEVQPLYDRLKDAVIKIERMGLTKIR
jgi:hypothetical protein